MAFRFGMTQSLRENGLLGERDIALQSTFARLPDYADGFWAPLETFTSHDLLYHMIIVSCIPDLHKKLIIGLADAMRRIGRAKLADMYEDMECLYYLAEMSPEEAFMNSIADIAFRSVRERRDEAIAREYIKRAFFEMRCLLAGRQENPFCREVFKYLREDVVELLVSQDPIKGLLFFPIKVCD